MDNPNCCGAGPHAAGTVKLMPTGGDGNLTLCRACWHHEIKWRESRNLELGVWAHYELPTWYSAKVYEV